MSKETFGQRLGRYVGKDKVMTAADIARRLDVSQAAVSRWKDGRIPDTLLLVALADLLGTTPKELLGSDYKEPLPADAVPSPRQGRPPRADADVVSYLDAVKKPRAAKPSPPSEPSPTRPKPGRASPR